jgi:hypothetical protein
MKDTCLSIYSRAVNAETPLAEVLGRDDETARE